MKPTPKPTKALSSRLDRSHVQREGRGSAVEELYQLTC